MATKKKTGKTKGKGKTRPPAAETKGPPARGRPGRQTKLTPAVHAAIVGRIEMGCFKSVAAQRAGVGEKAYHSWMAKGRAAGAEEPFKSFAHDVEVAEAHALGELTETIRKDPDWKAKAWVGERLYQSKLGAKRHVTVSGPDGGPVGVGVVDTSKLSVDQRKALIALRRAAASEKEGSEE